MSNLDTIRAACIAANSEIMELKPGCLLNMNCGESYGLITIHNETSVCKKHKKYREDCGAEENGCSVEEAIFGTSGNDEEWWQHTIKISDVKPYQILGRSIRLADMLLVVRRIPKKFADIPEAHYNETAVCNRWNLKKDNLEDQSEETLAFLASLLS